MLKRIMYINILGIVNRNKNMCILSLNIQTTSSNITMVKGRYREVGTLLWTTFDTNISNPQTPDITTPGIYELQIRIYNGSNWSEWFSVPNFIVGECCEFYQDNFGNHTFFDYSTLTSLVFSQINNLKFNNNGTKLFLLDTPTGIIFELQLSIAYDITSISGINNQIIPSGVNITGLDFNNDGTLLFYFDLTGGGYLHSLQLSTPFDLSTAGLDLSVVTDPTYTNQSDIQFIDNGNYFIINKSNSGIIEKWQCTTPYNVSNIVFSQTFDTGLTSSNGFSLSEDGVNLSITDDSNLIHNFKLITPFDITSIVNNGTIDLMSFDSAYSEGQDVIINNNNLYITESKNRVLIKLENKCNPTIDCSLNVDLLEYSGQSFNVGNETLTPTGVAFSSDGLNMYVTDSENEEILQYTLSIPFDLNTSIITSSFPIPLTNISGIFLKPDGTKYYYVDADSDRLYSFNMTTPFNISTSVLDTNIDISAYHNIPRNVCFSNDGLDFYIVGLTSNSITQFTCTTPFDISTATFTNIYNHSLASPQGIFMYDNDTKLIVADQSANKLYFYTLNTPKDITSISSIVEVFNLTTPQFSFPTGIYLNELDKLLFISNNGTPREENRVDKYEFVCEESNLEPPTIIFPFSPNTIVDSNSTPTTGGTQNLSPATVTVNAHQGASIVSYLWEDLTNTSGSGAFVDPNVLLYSYSPMSLGEHKFKLTVTDSNGLTSSKIKITNVTN